MICKNKCPELITPQEAIDLSSKYGTVESIDRAHSIAEAVKEREDAVCFGKDPRWIYLIALGTIYDAGRIQGIREERLKRKARL